MKLSEMPKRMDISPKKHRVCKPLPQSSPESAVRKYNKYTPEQYQCAIETYHDSADFHLAMERSGLPYDTTRLVLNKHFKDPTYTGPKRRGGLRRRLYNREDIVAKMKLFLQENPTLTLKELASKLEQPAPDPSTLNKWLTGAYITCKIVRFVPIARNTEETIQKRKEYGTWMTHLLQQEDHPDLVFLDEFGVNSWASRKVGRSRKGTPCSISVSSQRGVNMSCITAISETFGTLLMETTPTSVDSSKIEAFVFQLAMVWKAKRSHAGPHAPQRAIFIMDNAAIHRPAAMLEMLSGTQIELHFLPPWSPMLNPIETVNKMQKDRINKIMSEPAVKQESEAIERPGVAGKTEKRQNLIKRVIEQSWKELEGLSLTRIFDHCHSFLPDCNLGHDIENDRRGMAL